ncbi:hypothetical protein PR202_gb07627 [Eleusine coracana subsp. coracana]|uniref:DNA (cytosine-5-)-methyltransferase n=1 Tax=Eleusine coracana subsp. coracana TaxID=191504 RepID=A0AAV5ECN3_ELECO|nr:hypothetical protein PR202_gb07627 [Eleusine coracana subsp. coracana]
MLGAEEEVAAASNKRRCGGSSSAGKKPKPPPKKAKVNKARTKKEAAQKAERNEPPEEDEVCAEEPDEEEIALGEEDEVDEQERQAEEAAPVSPEKAGKKRVAQPHARRVVGSGDEHEPDFVGDPIPAAEARDKWPNRYDQVAAARSGHTVDFSRRPEDEEDVKARQHFRSAKVDNIVYCLNDDVYVKVHSAFHSELESSIYKMFMSHTSSRQEESGFLEMITEFFEGSDHHRYFTCRWFFRPEDTVINTLVTINIDGHKHDPKRVFLSEEKNDNVLDCIISKIKIVHIDPNMDPKAKAQLIKDCDLYYDMSYSVAYSTFANIPSENWASGSETASAISSDEVDLEMSSGVLARSATLLDLYSGCGGMSTGLCLGGALAGLKLETKWAVDLNSYACDSLKYNHPQTEVRNEKADEFLALLKEWAVLCDKYVHEDVGSNLAEEDGGSASDLDEDEFVVEKLIGICYGGNGRDNGLYFKVKWQGYGPEHDTWEPVENLSDCPLKIREFVQEGHRRRILPLPALPKYPLPTHDVVVRGGVPNAFSQSVVAYDETQKPSLKKALLLGDAISDLPKVENHQPHEVMEYGAPPKREFQRYIRLGRKGTEVMSNSWMWPLLAWLHMAVCTGPSVCGLEQGRRQGSGLRRSRINASSRTEPGGWSFRLAGVEGEEAVQGANFRDLRGVKVGANNIVEWDPEIERVYLPSGKPLVPDYAMSFIKGRSLKPFGRLWWDETVPTVVTRAEPHNQIILHPDQARVLTVRENARLQGFPDYYRLFGPIKEKYIQVGNAVAVPVARALGYCLGQAYLGESDGSDPLSMLPDSFTAIGQAVARASSVSIPAGEVLEQ